MRAISRVIMLVGITWFVGNNLYGCIAVAEPNPKTTISEKTRVEAVFVLDTTGSMGGMIQGAKEKIWSIANTLATAKPTPEIKIGLIAYRDRGDQYVTMMTPMSADLDAVYSTLMEYQAAGGGDGPESVNQGLHEAVSQIKWSKDAETYKVIFLVGDCPPHMDYQDDVKYLDSCNHAKDKGIVINTVLCGGNPVTMGIWKEIASKAGGSFFQVEQSGGAVVIETPYDEDLAKLSQQLDETRIFYGSKKEQDASQLREEVAEELAVSASLSAKAQRAIFNSSESGKKNFAWNKELVSAYEENANVLEEVTSDELPKELADLDANQLKEHIEKQSQERKNLQKEIRTLSEKRQAFIQEEMGKTKGLREKSLEYNVYRTIKQQTKDKSVSYDAEDAVY